jgi:hypothetical protein
VRVRAQRRNVCTGGECALHLVQRDALGAGPREHNDEVSRADGGSGRLTDHVCLLPEMPQTDRKRRRHQARAPLPGSEHPRSIEHGVRESLEVLRVDPVEHGRQFAEHDPWISGRDLRHREASTATDGVLSDNERADDCFLNRSTDPLYKQPSLVTAGASARAVTGHRGQ